MTLADLEARVITLEAEVQHLKACLAEQYVIIEDLQFKVF
jgi:uncharacterized coiled-coil protein SlyX